MIKKIIAAGLIGLFFVILSPMVPSVHAVGLKVAPLEYRTQLKSGENQKGFVDISNPTLTSVKVTTSVQGFKQVDDKGSLQFFDDEQLEKGIQRDLANFTLGPRQALRMYFLLDGKKLPTGDVYAALFFNVQSSETAKTGVTQAVRVGTLLSIVNKTPGERKAEITSLDVPFLQLGSMIAGNYTVHNTADPKKNTGFYPTIKTLLWPDNNQKELTASLVFAGRTRENSFNLRDVGFGLHKVTLQFKESSRSAWVFTADPFTGVVAAFLLLVISVELLFWWRRRRKASQLASTKH